MGGDICSDIVPCPLDDTSFRPWILILDAHTENVLSVIPSLDLNIESNRPWYKGSTVDLAFTHDGSKLIYAIGQDDPYGVSRARYGVWDMATYRTEAVLWNGKSAVPGIAISHDDKWIALLGVGGPTAKIWNVASAKFVAELPNPTDNTPWDIWISANDSRLAVDMGDSWVVIYDKADWQNKSKVKIPLNPTGDVTSRIALSPDLSLMATVPTWVKVNDPVRRLLRKAQQSLQATKHSRLPARIGRKRQAVTGRWTPLQGFSGSCAYVPPKSITRFYQ